MPSAAYFLNTDFTAQQQSDALAIARGIGNFALAAGSGFLIEEMIAERMELAPIHEPGWIATKVSDLVFGLKKHGLKAKPLSDIPIGFKKANIYLWRNRYARQASRYITSEFSKFGIEMPKTLLSPDKVFPKRLFKSGSMEKALSASSTTDMVDFVKSVRGKIGELVRAGNKASAARLASLSTGVFGQAMGSVVIGLDVLGMVYGAVEVAKGVYGYVEGLGVAARYYADRASGSKNTVPVPDFVDSQANQALRQAAISNLMASRQMLSNEASNVLNNPYKFYRYVGG